MLPALEISLICPRKRHSERHICSALYSIGQNDAYQKTPPQKLQDNKHTAASYCY